MQLETSVRTGDGAVGHLSEELGKIFSEGVEAITAGAWEALARTYTCGQHHHRLDLGGGTGSFLLAVLRHHAGLRTTLFEAPVVAALARKRIAATPLEEWMQVVEGDFFTDPIPDGHDAILLANVIHLFSPEHNLALLRRIRERVPDGARLLLVDFWTDPTHTQPTFAALLAGEFQIVTGEGAAYSEEEVRGWPKESGWQTMGRVPLAAPASLIPAKTAS